MEEVINRIIIAMDDLTPDQIRKLKNVLTINLSEKYSGKNEIVKDKNGWEIILKNYLCCKKA